MWNRYHWLTLRVKVPRGNGKPFSLRLPPMSIHTLRGAILSCDGLLWLIRGPAGRKARTAANTAQSALAVLQQEGLTVNVDAKDVSVHIYMI